MLRDTVLQMLARSLFTLWRLSESTPLRVQAASWDPCPRSCGKQCLRWPGRPGVLPIRVYLKAHAPLHGRKGRKPPSFVLFFFINCTVYFDLATVRALTNSFCYYFVWFFLRITFRTTTLDNNSKKKLEKILTRWRESEQWAGPCWLPCAFTYMPVCSGPKHWLEINKTIYILTMTVSLSQATSLH